MRENHARDSIVQAMEDGELYQGMEGSVDTEHWGPEVSDAATVECM